MLRLVCVGALVLALGGCTATIPEGRFACEMNAECPPGFTCIERRCRSMGGVDAGPLRDLGPRDLGSEDLGPEDLGPEDLGPSDPRDLGPVDLGADTGPRDACVPSMTELCNGLDDDCDGTIDDGFNLTNDPNNCGMCGLVCGGAMPGCCGGGCTDLAIDYLNCGSCGSIVVGGGYLCCNGAIIPQGNCPGRCSIMDSCREDCVFRGYCT